MDCGVPLRLLSSFSAGPGSVLRLLPEGARPDFAGVTRDGSNGTVTAVAEGTNADDYNITPNPGTLTVTDGTTMDISQLPEGLYILRCGSHSAKIVKQK